MSVSTVVRPTDAATGVPDTDLLADVTALLDAVTTERVGPPQARARLRDLLVSYPDCRVDLVWHEEPYDRTMLYDAVIRRSDGSTVSVSVAPRASLPWPLRGVVRASEQDLLQVNGYRLSVSEAIACLDFIWEDRGALQLLIDDCLVGAALDEDPVDFTEEALQEATDAFRRAKGLLSAEETHRWLAERSLSSATLTDLVRRMAAVAALRRRVTDGVIEPYFAEHREELAVLVVAWAQVSPAELTADPLGCVVQSCRAGRRAGVDQWRVSELPPGYERLAQARLGDVVPISVDGVTASACVLDRRDTVLDPPTRALIQRRVFDVWLAERRRDAQVEWFWGNAGRTGRAG